MRFFVLVGSAVRGPLTAEALRSLPGLSPETPVCPEDRDYKNQNNWKAASSYPQLLAQAGSELAPRDGGVSRFWRSGWTTTPKIRAGLRAPGSRRHAIGTLPAQHGQGCALLWSAYCGNG